MRTSEVITRATRTRLRGRDGHFFNSYYGGQNNANNDWIFFCMAQSMHQKDFKLTNVHIEDLINRDWDQQHSVAQSDLFLLEYIYTINELSHRIVGPIFHKKIGPPGPDFLWNFSPIVEFGSAM